MRVSQSVERVGMEEEVSSAKNVLEPVSWILQLLTGALMVILVTYHFYITHMTTHEALSYGEVMSRIGSFWGFYVVLLVIVTFHAFNGVRSIILDTDFGAKRRGAVNAVMYLIFVISSIYGVILLYNLLRL